MYGMVLDPIWKGEITVQHETFLVKVYRPFRDSATGKSVYVAETHFHGTEISVSDTNVTPEGIIRLLKKELQTLHSIHE
jgi:hypothetical protein